jgi:L-ascorbate metabolism protein UlaG (beta-lactamase superfamily)
VVVVSHENDRYHSHLGQITPPFEVVRGLEVPPVGTVAAGLRFEVVRVFETPEKRPGDEVTIVHFEADGLRLVHLGDLGHPLTDDELAPIRGAEVVFVPAGGPPTIALEEIPHLLDAIGPRLVVPMHFKTPKINLAIRPLDDFLAALPAWPVERPGTGTIEVGRESLPARPTVIVMEHVR